MINTWKFLFEKKIYSIRLVLNFQTQYKIYIFLLLAKLRLRGTYFLVCYNQTKHSDGWSYTIKCLNVFKKKKEKKESRYQTLQRKNQPDPALKTVNAIMWFINAQHF